MQPVTLRPGASLTFEDFGQEVVAIDLERGTYYSLKGAAAEVWRSLAAARPAHEGLRDLAAAYVLDAAALTRLAAFLADCEAEGLLAANGDVGAAVLAFSPGAEGPAELPELTLDKFTDIQDILLLDPIHDVDESGWPNTPSTPQS
jgi:hypothetical protein